MNNIVHESESSTNSLDKEDINIDTKSLKTKKNLQRIIIYILLISIVVLSIIIIYFITKNSFARFKPYIKEPLSYISSNQTLNPNPLGIITEAIVSTSVDPLTGVAINPETTFKSSDKNIFIVLTLNNAKQGTKISYARFLNKKFLDNKSFVLKKDQSKLFNFSWSIKNGATRPKGNYKIRLYTNGIYERTINFNIV